MQKRARPLAGPASVLGCQLGLGCSSVAGTLCAAGRSLEGMSLAFALMEAINGSTGSSARLAYGLKGTKPRRRQPGGGKILTAPRWRRKPQRHWLVNRSLLTFPWVVSWSGVSAGAVGRGP